MDERDGHRCVYRDVRGRRCTETRALEYHHRFPFAVGSDHHPDGVALLCSTHNRLMAEQDFGKETIERYRRSRAPATPT